MEKIKIKADIREVGKKGLNRRLRRDGFVPAILYGKKENPLGLVIGAKEFTALMKGASGINVLMDLEVAGEKSASVVMLKDYQTDALTHKITHIDLLKIDLKEKVTVKIPLHLTGKSVGATQGGLIEQSRRELEITCLPGNIPDKIDVDITGLDIGNSLHVKDLKLPLGVEIPHGVDFTIVSIVAPKEEEAAPVAAAVEGAVEGAAAAPAAAAGGTAPAAPAAPAGEKATAKGSKEAKGEKK